MGIHFSLDQMAVLRACARFFLRAREPASDGAESSHISNMLRFLRSVLQGFQALVTDREQALKKHYPACSDRKLLPDRHEGKFLRFRHFFKHSRYFFMTADVFIASAAHTLPLYTVAQLRALEADAARTLPPDTLMMRAGKATAAFIRQRGADCAAHRTWIAAGPGNNGGDALAAATELHQQGVSVEVCMPARVNAKDACHALDIARAAGVCITDTLPDQDVRKYQWAIDGLFGIGLTRPLDGIYAELARRLSRRTESGSPVLALDLPSGLNSDTGARVKNGSAVKATHTLTFIGVKAGLYTAD